MLHQQMRYAIIYAHHLLHSPYVFRRCSVGNFRELTPKFFLNIHQY